METAGDGEDEIAVEIHLRRKYNNHSSATQHPEQLSTS